MPFGYIQVLKETLRLYAIAPAITRYIPKDIVIDGIHIPGGVTATVMAIIYIEKFL